MTSEVEKMYKLANVQPQYKKRIECKEGYTIGKPCGRCHCIDCDKSVFEDVMPLFTAEKQLELIKWIARKGLIQINYSSHQCYQFNSFRIGGDYKADISEALASHYNNLWQDLTEEEKEQIKNILEG